MKGLIVIQNSKKLLFSGLAATVLFSTTLSAGVVLDAEVGIGSWKANPSGYASYDDADVDVEDNFGLESSHNTYIYADINHFVPIIPNARIEQQELKMDASSMGSSFKWNGNTIDIGSKTKLDLKQQDLLLYWGVPGIKLLTAGIVKVDFGLDIKKFDGSITVLNDKSS